MKRLFLSLYTLCLAFTIWAQGYRNPILPGFYPDPSVCRVNNDYYLVNSSFQFFPGVPIHHSKDLIHWEQIGYCLTRPSQARLQNATYWTGIYAPTIRYHQGTFYMVVSNVGNGGNFYVTTHDPAGPWSEPIWVDQCGIDPTLYFDDNGKCYFLSTCNGAIKMCEINISTGHRLTPIRDIWTGTGARYTEGPHIYKKDGYYYLMCAEGGTEYGHKESIARSHNIYGPYVSNPFNPILTHYCHAAEGNNIQGTGHADLIQAADGSWWMVCLAFRPQSGSHHLLGRETYLAPVTWKKNEWPIVNGNGTIAEEMKVRTLPQVEMPQTSSRDDFEDSKLGFAWNYLCIPHMDNYSLTTHPGNLRLKATTASLQGNDSPTFVGRRQQHINCVSTTAINGIGLKNNSEAGITVYMAANYHYDLAIVQNNGGPALKLTYYLGRMIHCEKEISLNCKQIYLRVEGEKDAYHFLYSVDNKTFITVGSMDTHFLSSETAGGFTGIYLGLYAQSKTDNGSYADIDWFEYMGIVK